MRRRRDVMEGEPAADAGVVQRAGKRSLSERLPVQRAPSSSSLPFLDVLVASRDEAPPVQASGGASTEPADVHAAASHGTSGAAGPLPFLDAIQPSFGRHGVEHVSAHTDGAAAAGARAMGADAFASGDHVAFAGAPTLHTAAHEAAHIVQQRAGVQLQGGVGEVGDAYEQHADEVADRVVRGQSAEGLLDRYAGGATGAAAATQRSVQRVVTLGKDTEKRTLTDDDIGEIVDGAFEYWRASEYYQQVVPHLTKPGLKAQFERWLASQPTNISQALHIPRALTKGNEMQVGAIAPTFGLPTDAPKAYWKEFATKEELYKQLIGETDPQEQANRQIEQNLANDILKNEGIAGQLNKLRKALAKVLWAQDSMVGKASYYGSWLVNFLPSVSGSYNEANAYPSPWWESTKPIIADLESGGVGGGPGEALAGLPIVVNWLLGRRDRLKLLFDERDFTVAENIAILHDVKELFSKIGNSRALPTAHSTLVPDPYKGKQAVASRSTVKPADGAIGSYERRENKIPKMDRKTGKPITDRRTGGPLMDWDRGRTGLGTRDESSPDTVAAREHHMPVETGRSHTAARLLEMVNLLHPGAEATEEQSAEHDQMLDAMANGIFGFWNASEGGYPPSLTPVHTYHEVMDVADEYRPGIYPEPFEYPDADTFK